jgi:hypothetical protein
VALRPAATLVSSLPCFLRCKTKLREHLRRVTHEKSFLDVSFNVSVCRERRKSVGSLHTYTHIYMQKELTRGSGGSQLNSNDVKMMFLARQTCTTCTTQHPKKVIYYPF